MILVLTLAGHTFVRAATLLPWVDWTPRLPLLEHAFFYATLWGKKLYIDRSCSNFSFASIRYLIDEASAKVRQSKRCVLVK